MGLDCLGLSPDGDAGDSSVFWSGPVTGMGAGSVLDWPVSSDGGEAGGLAGDSSTSSFIFFTSPVPPLLRLDDEWFRSNGIILGFRTFEEDPVSGEAGVTSGAELEDSS